MEWNSGRIFRSLVFWGRIRMTDERFFLTSHFYQLQKIVLYNGQKGNIRRMLVTQLAVVCSWAGKETKHIIGVIFIL